MKNLYNQKSKSVKVTPAKNAKKAGTSKVTKATSKRG